MKESDIHAHVPEERAHLFEAPDAGSTEDETREFLSALVRCFKPECVLETGAWKGSATATIALALRRNGFGKVISLECDPEAAAQARSLLSETSLSTWAEIILQDSVSWLSDYRGAPFGLALLDSSFEARPKELVVLRTRRLALGPVLVHDTSRLRAKSLPSEADQHTAFLSALDAFGLPFVENPLSRGWRLYDLRSS